jgi:hypothetical protein
MNPGEGSPVPVQSSVLASVRYHAETSILDLKFRAGVTYRYFDVPADIHNPLLTADSKGSCFHHLIRNRFPYQRLHRQS